MLMIKVIVYLFNLYIGLFLEIINQYQLLLNLLHSNYYHNDYNDKKVILNIINFKFLI